MLGKVTCPASVTQSVGQLSTTSKPTTKTNEAVSLWLSGKFKEALRILKDFRLGLDKNERGSILTLHEMYTCEKQQKFYEFLGMRKEEIQAEVNNIVTLKLITA